MDEDSIRNFEHILQNKARRVPLALYRDDKNRTSQCFPSKYSCSAKDVILSVNKQIKEIQKADTIVPNKQHKKALDKYKKASFLPVDMLPRESVVQNQRQANRFETQCVSDTQLIDLIDNAEAIANSNIGITQEFESTFCEIEDNTNNVKDEERNMSVDILDGNNDLGKKSEDFKEPDKCISHTSVSRNEDNFNINTQIKLSDRTSDVKDESPEFGEDTKALIDKVIKTDSVINKNEIGVNEINEDITPSPIFQVRQSKSPTPLIFDLISFEKFEKIAHPIIEENPDLSSAKQLINSQIIGKELLIQSNLKCEINVNRETSPILKLNTEKLRITKTLDDNMNVSTHNNKDEIPSQQIKRTNNTFLEDEILFSSDEEEEYRHKEFQDIPLTCALETSFYEQPDMLDKTMYVGFQTASNRSIQIHTDSFNKAKCLLDELEKDVAASTSLTELVDILSSKQDNVNNDNSATQVTDIVESEDIKLNFEINNAVSNVKNEVESDLKNGGLLCKDENLVEKEIETLKRLEKRKFDGFMMASTKKIKLSDIALARCKRVFQDIDLEEDFEQPIEKNIDNSEHIKEMDQPDIDDDILHEFSRDMSLLEEDKSEKAFFGSRTASKKEMNISDAALAKTKTIFDDIDVINDFDNFTNSTTSKNYGGFKTASCKEIKISNAAMIRSNAIFHDIIIDKNETEMPIEEKCENVAENNFVGFKTASNKDIRISEQALLKSKDIFNDIDKDNNIEHTDNDKIKHVKPLSKESNVKPNDIKDLNEELCEHLSTEFENEIMDIESESNPFRGFKTASNKQIKVSEKALLDSKKMFADIDSDENVSNQGQHPGMLKKSQTEVYPTVKHCNNTAENKSFNLKNNTRISFKTANNKPINISKRALERSIKIFEDLDHVNEVIDENEKVIPLRGFQRIDKSLKSFSGKSDNTLNSALNINNDDNISNNFKRFKAANNKPLAVSSDALAQSKAVFKDMENLDNNPKYTDLNVLKDATAFIGFQTANNNPISVSKEALAKSKKLFEGLDCDENLRTNNVDTSSNKFNNNSPIFKGFHTANNKLVDVSAEAIAKSKSIFKDLDCETNERSTRNDFEFKNSETRQSFGGFQTASNKRLSVSTEALARSKLLFKDIDEEVNNGKNELVSSDKETAHVFKGFQTASKKPVPISAEALAKSKALFKDIDQDISEKKTTCVTDTIKKFEGFKTANLRPITISKQALAKSKALFQDIDSEKDNVDKNDDKFKGFQTGNNKPVKISEVAMLKSKRLFEDIDGYKENEATSNQFKGFQTASNKKVKISEQALKKTRQIFQNIDLSDNCEEDNSGDVFVLRNESSDSKKSYAIDIKSAKGDDILISKESLLESKKRFKEANENIDIEEPKVNVTKRQDTSLDKLIDTQVINNFEETLCTEDFCKDTTPRQSKRSGSPILSCPKAKRRKKFETPYRNDVKSPSIGNLKTPIVNSESVITFNNDYKKNKRLNLTDLAKVEKIDKKANIDPYILNFNLDNFLEFEFTGKRNDLSDGKMSIEDIKEIFQKAINKKLIPIGWLENHLKLIIWKLISYEIRFPSTLSGVCKVKNVLEQLKYRFDRELYNAERPALRRILEKDDVASKTLVLCVAGIFVDGVSVKSVTNITSKIELLLTDGWYCVKACIDKMLTKLVYDEKLAVGCKIVTNGAELVNCEQGVSPWEDTTSVRFKLHGNSTRRARWDARLGYHGNGAILSQLSAVTPDGGKVSKLRLFVARVYPMLYVEKFEDGSTVTRSERLEHIHQAKYESEKQIAMEKLYEEVEKELSDQESQDSLNSQRAAKHAKCLSDSRITESQVKSLEEKSNRKREKLLQNVQERVRRKIEEKGLDIGRNVVTLLKVRVAGVHVKNGSVIVTKGLMSIWKPNELLTEIIKEGSWIDVMSVVPTAIRYSEIHLSAGRNSIFCQSRKKEDDVTKPYTQSLKRTCYSIKELFQNPTKTTDYNEVDTIGLIFQIDEESNQPFQNIYLTDSEKNMICINFWGGLKKFGFQNILEVGYIVYGTNLQKRAGNTRKSVPHFRVTEFSYFTKTPKNVPARRLIDDLEKKFTGLDKKKYCEECVYLKNNFSAKNVIENVSPYRFDNDHNLTKNKVFLESPLAARCEDINLTGLDFESTFKQIDTQEMSPKMLQRKRLVKQKIAKLKMIGEPPPLCPLNIINKSKCALNSYKSPLASVTSLHESYQNSRNCKDIQSSPVMQCDTNIRQNNVTCDNQNSRISEELPCSPLVQTIRKGFQAGPLLRTSVTSIKKSYQCSRINDDIQSSPVFSMNRTYVKNFNPVKLNFSNGHDNSLDDTDDQFAEEFDGSPPLSLE